MNARCKPNGNVQRKHGSYVGVYHTFDSFNAFSEWAQKQVGYGEYKFQLDKDFLSKDCKVYSPETCVFIPQSLNKFILEPCNKTHDLPTGVCFEPRWKRFTAYCNDENCKREHLGSFGSPEEASSIRNAFKERVARILAGRWKGKVDDRVHDMLINYKSA